MRFKKWESRIGWPAPAIGMMWDPSYGVDVPKAIQARHACARGLVCDSVLSTLVERRIYNSMYDDRSLPK